MHEPKFDSAEAVRQPAVKSGIILKYALLKGASSCLVITTLLVSTSACLASSSKSKSVRAHKTARTIPAQKDNYFQQTTRGNPHRWLDSDMPLRVWIKPATGVASFKPLHEETLRLAIKEWQNSLNSKVSFRYVTEAPADITVQFVDRINPKTYTAGYTTYEITPHRIFNVRIKLGTGMFGQDEWFRTTCLHELGHALGLEHHSLDPHDTMYLYNNMGQKALSSRDIKTIQMLYGSNAPVTVNASKPAGEPEESLKKPPKLSTNQPPELSTKQPVELSTKQPAETSWKRKAPPMISAAQELELMKTLEPELSTEQELAPLTKQELDLIATVPSIPEAPFKIKLSPTEHIAYNERLVARLKQYFSSFPTRESLECEISCMVDNKGNIYNYKVVKESPIEQFDSTALTSLIMALPLPSIPTKEQVPSRTPICLRFFSNGCVVPKMEPSSWEPDYLTADEKPTPAKALKEVAKITDRPATDFAKAETTESEGNQPLPGEIATALPTSGASEVSETTKVQEESEVPSKDNNDWNAAVSKKAHDSWTVAGSGKTEVLIGIKSNGRIAHLVISSTTGDESFEKSVLTACVSAEPYPVASTPPGDMTEVKVQFESESDSMPKTTP